MLDTIGGIPLHPLIVHAVVVLVPLASLLLLLAAVSPRIRHWAGILTPITATLALVMVPLATQSGEALEKRVDASPRSRSTRSSATACSTSSSPWRSSRGRCGSSTDAPGPRSRPPTRHSAAPTAPPCRSFGLMTAVIVLSVVSVLATTVQVIRIGHSGASASWSDVGAKTVPAGGGDGD